MAEGRREEHGEVSAAGSREGGSAPPRLAVRVICRPGVAAGFDLAGIPAVEAKTGLEAGWRLEEARRAADIGVVLVEEALFREVPKETAQALERAALPLVVPFPGAEWAERLPAEEYVVELLRRAVGYRVKLR